MVRIPVYDSPQVGYQPVNLPQASAPGQQMVMGNAPQAMAESGKAIAQAGESMFQLGSQMQISERYEEQLQQRQAAINERIKNERAELQAVSTLNLYQETSTNIRDDYELLDGVNAMDSYPATTRKLEDARKAAEESLKDNPIALQMFAMRADRVDAGTRARFARHHDKAVKAATLGNHAASIEFNTKAMHDSAMAMGIEDLSYDPKTGEPQGFVAEYTQAMINVESSLNTIHKAKGLTPAQAKVERDELYSKLNARIVDDLLSTGQEPKALKYFQLSESTIQDPKVRERVTKVVTEKREAERLQQIDQQIRSYANTPVTYDMEIDGKKQSVTVPQRFSEAAFAKVDELLAQNAITMEQAKSLKTQYTADQNQIDESAAKQKASVQSDAKEFALRYPGATLQTLVQNDPALAVRAQKAGALAEVESILTNGGKPITTPVGRAMLGWGTEQWRSIRTEDEFNATVIPNASQDDAEKMRKAWKAANGIVDIQPIKDGTKKTLLEEYFNEGRNFAAFVDESEAHLDTKLREGVIQRNSEREYRRAAVTSWLEQKAQEIAGKDRIVTEEHYRAAMMHVRDTDQMVRVKRNFRGSTEEEIDLTQYAMADADRSVARYAISPAAEAMWKETGKDIEELVAVARNLDTVQNALMDDSRSLIGPLPTSTEYDLAEQQHVSRRLLEEYAKNVYMGVIEMQQAEQAPLKKAVEERVQFIASKPELLKEFQYLESEFGSASEKQKYLSVQKLADKFKWGESDYSKNRYRNLYEILMYYKASAANEEAKPKVKPGLKLERDQ